MNVLRMVVCLVYQGMDEHDAVRKVNVVPYPDVGWWASPEDIVVKGTATFFSCAFDRCKGLAAADETGKLVLDEVPICPRTKN